MLDFYPVYRSDLLKGNFPLNHDCVLKVVYLSECPMPSEYFTCRAQDSGSIADILCKLTVVERVKISSSDKISDIW